MQGLLGSNGGYDMGIEIGTEGIGKDDLQVYTFTLDSSLRDLTLADFSLVDFGVRLTSVGDIGGTRDDSCKLGETTFKVVTPNPDVTDCVDEDTMHSGNVLTNDHDGLSPADILSVTSWSGDGHASIAAGQTIVLTNAEGATLVLNADGTFTLDANAADALSEGEHLNYTFTYNILQTNDTDSATASSTLTVSVCGVNDGPIANDDDFSNGETNCIQEGALYNGASVLGNDTDIDRLDTMSVVAINDIRDGAAGDLDATAGSIKIEIFDGANSLGFVTMHSDGTFAYDQNGTLDAMNDGDHQMVNFNYTMSDNNGAEDSALVTLCVDGEGDGGGGGGGGDFPDFDRNSLSNIVFYLDNDDDLTNNIDNEGNSTLIKVKIDDATGTDVTDLNALNLHEWLADHYAGDQIVAFSIHGGQEFPNTWDASVGLDLQNGEGILFVDADPLLTVMGNGNISDELLSGQVVEFGGNDFTAFHEYLGRIGVTDALLTNSANDAYNLTSIDPTVIVPA